MDYLDNVDIKCILDQGSEFFEAMQPHLNRQHLYGWLEQTLDPHDPGDGAVRWQLHFIFRTLNAIEGRAEVNLPPSGEC